MYFFSAGPANRAPEVTLGLPISEQVDMWGLGCALTFLHIGHHLFATNCEYQMVNKTERVTCSY